MATPARLDRDPCIVAYLSISGFDFARFVHLFDHLKGEKDIGHFAGFAVPYQFHFALVVKEHKAVFVGEGLIRLDEFEYFAFFVVGKFHLQHPFVSES